jgi:glycosyltransferase involved in cell wall biosynthesis
LPWQQLKSPSVLIYRNHLLPFSETFILNQADALRSYTPVFTGRLRVGDIDLAGHETVVLNEGGLLGKFREARDVLGRPPRDFVARLESLSPALLHAQFGTSAVDAMPLQSRLGVPLVVTFHGYDTAQSAGLRDGLPMWRYGRRRLRLVDAASCMLAVSEHIRERVIALGVPESRIRTHYIGVDLTKYSVFPREGRESVVLGVGRFVEGKGFEFLIDAMAAVQRSLPDLEFVLIGSGELESDLRTRAAEKLKSFRIFGPCPPTEVAAWMQRARMLVVPSITNRFGHGEGLPITVLEALASGLPVVATRLGGIPEAIVDGTSGFLVEEKDVPALAARIFDLARDDAGWTSIAASGRETVERTFDLAAQTRQLEDVYARVT